jgi:hypothetical protein
MAVDARAKFPKSVHAVEDTLGVAKMWSAVVEEAVRDFSRVCNTVAFPKR